MNTRRPTAAGAANDMYGVFASSSQQSSSGIPLPASTIKRRADPPPSTSQPPHNRMRMSTVGGAGPLRGSQQLGASAAASQHYAPRASLFGGGLQANNLSVPQTVRRTDANQHGKTPMRNGLQASTMAHSGRRGTTSVRPPGFMSMNWAIPREIRPIKDRAFQALMQREILEYLTQARCPIPNMSIKTLQTPTNAQFHQMFQFLVNQYDDRYVFGREKKPDEEIISILRDMRYPLADTISKTSLATPGSSSSWPGLLAMLHWITTVLLSIGNWGDPEICPDNNLLSAQDLPIDEEIPNFAELVSCDYIVAAYNQFMYGADDFRAQDQELETLVDRKNEAVIQRCEEKELVIAKLKSEILKLKANPSELVALDKEHDKFQVDLQKLRLVTEDRESKTRKNQENTRTLEEYIAKSESDIADLAREHQKILARIAEQGLTPEEVAQLGTDRDNLRRTLDDLIPKSSEAARITGELEIAVSKRADSVEQVVNRYTTLAYTTGMVPSPPAPFQTINFRLELNTAVSNPMEMLKADMRNEIHPSLRQVADTKRKERAAVEDERIHAEDELDRLTQQCETMMEEAEPRENQLKILLNKTEELRETVAAETAAANSEASKLERDVGQIEASVQQSEVALRSRKQRLQVEFADIVHKTEHLKEDTKKKITAECNQMLKFKQDIAKELEGLVIFARDS